MLKRTKASQRQLPHLARNYDKDDSYNYSMTATNFDNSIFLIKPKSAEHVLFIGRRSGLVSLLPTLERCMFFTSSYLQIKGILSLSLLLTVSIVTQSFLCQPAFSFPFATKKQSNIHTPTEEKLKSNTVESNSAEVTSSNEKQSAKSCDLAPIDLSKSTQSEEKQNADKNLLERANKVNIMPITLLRSAAEMDSIVEKDLEYERNQISALWEATLKRSADIQFVVQKLIPSSDKNRTTNILMRMISSSITSVANTAQVAYGPSPATLLTSQLATSAITQGLDLHNSKAQRNVQLDQTQAIILYQMVRGIADKLTEHYRDYKFRVKSIDYAQARTMKLQNLIQDARAGQDAIKQIEMEYWMDKAKTDIEEAVYIARRYRQSLIDIAGIEAVDKLDQSFQEQFGSDKDVPGEAKAK